MTDGKKESKGVLKLSGIWINGYSFLLTLGFLVLLPRFLFDALRQGKYTAGWRERLGLLTPPEDGNRPVVWVHCVSVGETQAARPLVKGILRKLPNHCLVVSTITLTGQKLAREVFANDAAKVFYFPFDWAWSVRRALRTIQPSAVVIMETELWPRFLYECSLRRVPVAIVNGRVSTRSYRRYRSIKWFVARMLQAVTLAVMQTEADAERICRLGLEPKKVRISGNLKFDAGKSAGAWNLVDEMRSRFNLSDSPLILCASTHAPEERIMLDAFSRVRTATGTQARLMLAPRHPERFGEVASLLEESGLRWTRRTALPEESDAESEVILLDTIGELPAIYPLASIVFVGGSISKSGGHNILEPAAVGACIVTGINTYNFEAIMKSFIRADAVIQLPAVSENEAKIQLAKIFSELLDDQKRRQELGQRARNLVEQNFGATERTLKFIGPILGVQDTTVKNLVSLAAHGGKTG